MGARFPIVWCGLPGCTGRRAGQIVKGGDFRTSEQRLRASMRVEIPPFDAVSGKATALPTIGFRLVMSAPVSASLARIDALRAAFAAIERGRGGETDPIALLRRLAEEATDPDMRRAVEAITQALSAERTARGRGRKTRSAKSTIYAAVMMIRSIRDLDRRMQPMKARWELAEKTRRQKPGRSGRMEGRLSGAWCRPARSPKRAYRDILVQTADDLDRARITAALNVLTGEFDNQGLPSFVRFAKIFVAQVTDYAARPVQDDGRWYRQLLAD